MSNISYVLLLWLSYHPNSKLVSSPSSASLYLTARNLKQHFFLTLSSENGLCTTSPLPPAALTNGALTNVRARGAVGARAAIETRLRLALIDVHVAVFAGVAGSAVAPVGSATQLLARAPDAGVDGCARQHLELTHVALVALGALAGEAGRPVLLTQSAILAWATGALVDISLAVHTWARTRAVQQEVDDTVLILTLLLCLSHQTLKYFSLIGLGEWKGTEDAKGLCFM